jgi:NAD-dependent SIR2 family protein deacetylase
MWKKIQELRELIKQKENSGIFKERKCWSCGSDLNIYDFLSDNIEFSAKQILSLWQSTILEFHCCECFKMLKSSELEELQRKMKTRSCAFCNKEFDVFWYNKLNNYLKIYEIAEVWLNERIEVFCSKLCRMKFNKELRNSSLKID